MRAIFTWRGWEYRRHSGSEFDDEKCRSKCANSPIGGSFQAFMLEDVRLCLGLVA
jgi:hypothetical protein